VAEQPSVTLILFFPEGLAGNARLSQAIGIHPARSGAVWHSVRLPDRLKGMELSLFLAKLFGIYLLIVAILWGVRGEVISNVIDEFFTSRPMLFLSGLLALAIGIAMAISHSVCELNWRGLITLFGYLSIAKGIVRIGFPEVPKKAAGFLLTDTARWIWIGLALVLGGFLTWKGFTGG
jgi:vacuolar-type H+-ATPase subunit I/STV1